MVNAQRCSDCPDILQCLFCDKSMIEGNGDYPEIKIFFQQLGVYVLSFAAVSQYDIVMAII
jgi:hypothetical protein